MVIDGPNQSLKLSCDGAGTLYRLQAESWDSKIPPEAIMMWDFDPLVKRLDHKSKLKLELETFGLHPWTETKS